MSHPTLFRQTIILYVGLLPAAAAMAASGYKIFIDPKDAYAIDCAVTFFKSAFCAASLQGLADAYQKEPGDTKKYEKLGKALEAGLLVGAAASPWGKLALEPVSAIAFTSLVPGLVTYSIPYFSKKAQAFVWLTSVMTAVFSAVSIAQRALKEQLIYTNVAGAILSVAFIPLAAGGPDRLFKSFSADEKVNWFAVGNAASMFLSVITQAVGAGLPFNEKLFPWTVFLLSVGSACVLGELIVLAGRLQKAAGGVYTEVAGADEESASAETPGCFGR